MRLLVLLTDGFGGRGGIAAFNRELLAALSGHSGCEEVVALPRVVVDEPGELPPKLDYRADAAGGKARYALAVVRALARGGYDGVVCGHIHLLPLAWLAARRCRAPLLLVVHGIEAWQPTRRRLVNRLAARVDAVVSVSETTRRRFGRWAGVRRARTFVVPNCVDASRFGPGPKRRELVELYGLEGKRVLLTLARLSASERYKGVDEVLDALPVLASEFPDLVYVIAGDGDDRPRLDRKAAALGVADRVVFTGYVPEHEKADHYRLADAFVMPGRGEGFGIVYLEALACGVPVVASSADASREAVLDGELGVLVDPEDPTSVVAGIRAALARTERRVPEGLEAFSIARFRARWRGVVDDVFAATVSRASEYAALPYVAGVWGGNA